MYVQGAYYKHIGSTRSPPRRSVILLESNVPITHRGVKRETHLYILSLQMAWVSTDITFGNPT